MWINQIWCMWIRSDSFCSSVAGPFIKKTWWYLLCAVPALAATTCEQKNQRPTYPPWNCILEDAPVRCQVPFYQDIFTKAFIIHWRFRFCQELRDLWQTQGFLADEFWVSKQNVKPKNHCPLGVAEAVTFCTSNASTKALCYEGLQDTKDTSEEIPNYEEKRDKKW